MRIVTLIGLLIGATCLTAGAEPVPMQELPVDTTGGLVERSGCMYKPPCKVYPTGRITCGKDNLFVDLTVLRGSPTGTPPWLTYDNYIGSYVEPSKGPKMPGSGTRIMFFNGEPKLKTKSVK